MPGRDANVPPDAGAPSTGPIGQLPRQCGWRAEVKTEPLTAIDRLGDPRYREVCREVREVTVRLKTAVDVACAFYICIENDVGITAEALAAYEAVFPDSEPIRHLREVIEAAQGWPTPRRPALRAAPGPFPAALFLDVVTEIHRLIKINSEALVDHRVMSPQFATVQHDRVEAFCLVDTDEVAVTDWSNPRPIPLGPFPLLAFFWFSDGVEDILDKLRAAPMTVVPLPAYPAMASPPLITPVPDSAPPVVPPPAPPRLRVHPLQDVVFLDDEPIPVTPAEKAYITRLIAAGSAYRTFPQLRRDVVELHSENPTRLRRKLPRALQEILERDPEEISTNNRNWMRTRIKPAYLVGQHF